MKSKTDIVWSDLSARLISDLANPLLFPSLVVILMAWYSIPTAELFWKIGSIALVSYTLIPLFVAYFLLKNGHLSSLDAPNQKSRNRLFLYSIISSASGSMLLYWILQSSHPLLAAVALIYLVNPVIGLLINLKWKISIHTASLAVATTLLAFFSIAHAPDIAPVFIILSFCMLLLLLPLMVWARFHLEVHSISELAGGIIVGFIVTISELFIIL